MPTVSEPLTGQQKVADFLVRLVLFILCPSAYGGAAIMVAADEMQSEETRLLLLQVEAMNKMRDEQHAQHLKWRKKEGRDV